MALLGTRRIGQREIEGCRYFESLPRELELVKEKTIARGDVMNARLQPAGVAAVIVGIAFPSMQSPNCSLYGGVRV